MPEAHAISRHDEPFKPYRSMILTAHDAESTDDEDCRKAGQGADSSVAVRCILRDDARVQGHGHEHQTRQSRRRSTDRDEEVVPLVRLIDVCRSQASGISRP
jgi:hypothetical protein